MQFVMRKSIRKITNMGMKVKLVICSKLLKYMSRFTKSVSVIDRQPIVLPKVPAKVNKKLGFKKPFNRLGGVNLAVRVVIATSIISIPIKVITKPIECKIIEP